ncbi:hypothetical protein C922_03126 [Plasmodium inui San Antonio 1]|uniref:Ubiquinol-cytochrome c chaperone domain-containing protein n=1 Tax=Plasmodium inui San Antonio 1 TaxID=1237626 RepID=W6ZZY5_9APIC|nr:hypothetical protein C922_03126 [Plasmodium inui San Antonio 1]EUD66492.1 hypothetical protein C922_03126 [Plasmodium inui San Antonio 1]
MNQFLLRRCQKFKPFKTFKRSKCLINNALSNKNLKWKTTNESYCEYILTPEEEAELRQNHFRIIASNDINVDGHIMNEGVKNYKDNMNTSTYYKELNSNLNDIKSGSSVFFHYYVKILNSLMEKVRNVPIINYLYNNIVLRYRVNIHVFVSPLYDRINNEKLFVKFQINKNDVRQIMYFLCMHVWIYCAKLNTMNNRYLKILLWELIWDYYRALLIKYKISEFSFNTYLINMQEYSLGFCIGLDECIGKEFYAGNICNLLFNHIYNEKDQFKNSRELIDLTIYCIRMYHFVLQLPEDNFTRARFTWPDLK